MNHITQRNYSSIERMSENLLNYKSAITNPATSESKPSFDKILQEKQGSAYVSNELKFSKHANERLASRNIDLSETQLERLASGTKKAHEKGINESLVMVDNIAFIVNVNNNTVITAVNDSDDKIFTNIDGAVII